MTRIQQFVLAPRPVVYRALLDPLQIVRWRVPAGMTCQIHVFEAREGGAFRVSLTYDASDAVGKTSAHADTYHGRFVKLLADQQVVERLEFETADPALQGEMTIRTTLYDSGPGTIVEGVHEDLPPGLSPHDNELGWRMALANLARLLEPAG